MNAATARVLIASTEASGVPEKLEDELTARRVADLLDVEHCQEVEHAA